MNEDMHDLSRGNCPKCGGALEEHAGESTRGRACSRCGWGVVSTYIPEIDRDTTTYTIVVLEADMLTPATVRAVSTVARVNFLEARKLLMNVPSKVFDGNAREVGDALDLLRGVGLAVQSEPDYPYDAESREGTGPRRVRV